ncbi:hypothetical protein [Myxococcus hansupus]|uniref:hypothetical protein n=1 Tax=Pseudomyxococcus hansupus TaxID=1297742 RepID=UPI0005D12762|nr:hypothetical protein [Myxococcus hansupus]
MGDWGNHAWETDEGADWFGRFWAEGWPLLIAEIKSFDPVEERYEQFRAAAHVLASFGSPFMVPSRYVDELAALLRKSIEVLGHMIAPPSDDWTFLELWGGDEAVKDDVSTQIAALQATLARLP